MHIPRDGTSRDGTSRDGTSRDGTSCDESGCDHVVGLLPWLLNGTLDPPERAAVEAHLGVCGECCRELGETVEAWEIAAAHIPGLDLARHAQGLADSTLDRDLIVQHLAACESCRQELESASTDRIPDFAAARSARRAAPRRARRWLPLAAGLTLLLGASVFFRGLKGPELPSPAGDGPPTATEPATASAPASTLISAETFESGTELFAASTEDSAIFSGGFETGSMNDWSGEGPRPAGTGASDPS